MKIVFIGGRDIHKLGGIEAYMYNLCTELVKLGVEPLVYCESDRDEIETLNGFTVIHQKSINSRFWTKPILGLKAIKRTLKEHPDIDVYHFNAGGPAYFGWIARLCGKRTIYQGHGIEWRRTKWSPFHRLIMQFTNMYVVVFCTKYATAVSEEQTEMLWKRYRKKCKTINCAVNLPQSVKNDTVLDRFGLRGKKYFLYLGRLVQDKNPDFLIKAFNTSGSEDWKLVIAGSNDSAPEYVNYLKELAKGNNRIIFTGAVYGDDKETLMANCGTFCIPSTIEGLSITLLEAMSYGRICIASDIQANKEALADNAIWVKAEDLESLKSALKRVMLNYDVLNLSGKKNYQRVIEHFTWPKVAKEYYEMVCEITKK